MKNAKFNWSEAASLMSLGPFLQGIFVTSAHSRPDKLVIREWNYIMEVIMVHR